jgi:hypothetical protein
MGDSINMAARLMCHAEAHTGILCDEKTYNLCETDFNFLSLGETKVKGKNTAIAIFRPLGPKVDPGKAKKTEKVLTASEIIGRSKEKSIIQAALEKVGSDDVADVIVISAENGQGLTTMGQFLKADAGSKSCHLW